jgi:serine/threonine protein kinase
MLPAHVGASRSMLAAVQRDFARLRTLEHPNIARLLELGSNGQHYYVTAERLDGEPLREVLNHLMPERPAVAEADGIVRAVGSALVYAHEHDIAHGDVRAENVLVTMDGRYVLTNFLTRRVAKVAGRPPRPSDDLKGLARLAAELYTGSISPHALRAAVHDDVPAARLNAIRSVLEPSSRRPSTVARFLAAADLELTPLPSPSPRKFAERKQHRSWSISDLISVYASMGQTCHQGSDAPGRPLLHLFRHLSQTSAGKRVNSGSCDAPLLVRFLCSIWRPFLRPDLPSPAAPRAGIVKAGPSGPPVGLRP